MDNPWKQKQTVIAPSGVDAEEKALERIDKCENQSDNKSTAEWSPPVPSIESPFAGGIKLDKRVALALLACSACGSLFYHHHHLPQTPATNSSLVLYHHTHLNTNKRHTWETSWVLTIPTGNILLTWQYRPTDDRTLFDGVGVNEIKWCSLRSHISADGSEVPAMMKLDVIGNVFRHWPLLTQFTIYITQMRVREGVSRTIKHSAS